MRGRRRCERAAGIHAGSVGDIGGCPDAGSISPCSPALEKPTRAARTPRRTVISQDERNVDEMRAVVLVSGRDAGSRSGYTVQDRSCGGRDRVGELISDSPVQRIHIDRKMIRDPHLSNEAVPNSAGRARGLVRSSDSSRGIGDARAISRDERKPEHRQGNPGGKASASLADIWFAIFSRGRRSGTWSRRRRRRGLLGGRLRVLAFGVGETQNEAQI
jgi:hypothetical protein